MNPLATIPCAAGLLYLLYAAVVLALRLPRFGRPCPPPAASCAHRRRHRHRHQLDLAHSDRSLIHARPALGRLDGMIGGCLRPCRRRRAWPSRSELRPLGRLAWPVILADRLDGAASSTLMVGPPAEAIGGVGPRHPVLRRAAAWASCSGSTPSSAAYGAGDHDATGAGCGRAVARAVRRGAARRPAAAAARLPRSFGVNPAILAIVHGNLDAVADPGAVVSGVAALLQAIGLVRPVPRSSPPTSPTRSATGR